MYYLFTLSTFLSSQGGNNSTVCKLLHSSAASKLKHLQQNTADNSKSGKKEEFLKMQGEQQVLSYFITIRASACLIRQRMYRWNCMVLSGYCYLSTTLTLLCCQSAVRAKLGSSLCLLKNVSYVQYKQIL